jgi:hypothetical protein
METNMSVRIDAKGKVFTDIVRKDEVPVLIQTTSNLIHGFIFLRPEMRVKDEMNHAPDKFIAVTQAEVYNAAGQVLVRSSFLTVNKDHIIWVRPDEEKPGAPSGVPNP